jgi:hypothetical protein
MLKHSLIITTSLLALTHSAVQAEVISIAAPSYQVENSTSGVLRPTRGMSMTRVEQQFGLPQQKFNAVGEPPITRWVYGEFSVFFEHNLVIHSVVPR